MKPVEQLSHDRNDKTRPKLPYVKPAIISEPIYETFALACAKLPGQGSTCNASPRRS
jgi:hypothetical protein